MNRKKIFERIAETRTLQIVFFVVSMCIVIGVYAIISGEIKKVVSYRYIIEEDKNLIKNIEKVYFEDNELVIIGWCFYKDIDSKNQNIQVFLRNVNDEKDTVWLEVERKERKEIDTYYDCEYDYSQTGFEARIKKSRLDLQEEQYEILIKICFEEEQAGGLEEKTKGHIKKEKTVSTKKYLVKGCLSPVKNREFVPSKTTFEIMSEKITENNLITYREGVDLYAYLNKGKLYWIAGEDFCFEEDGTTYIYCQIYTTDNVYDVSFTFEANEIEAKGIDLYRVAVTELPVKQAILYLWIGYSIKDMWLLNETTNIDINEVIKD